MVGSNRVQQLVVGRRQPQTLIHAGAVGQTPLIGLVGASGKGSDGVDSVDPVLIGDHLVRNAHSCVWTSSVREQDLVDLQQRLLVVHEELQHVRLVSASEVGDFDLVLCHLSQLEQTSLEVFRFLSALVDPLELLGVQDLSLESPLHDVLSGLFDALDEQVLEVVLLLHLTDLFEVLLLVEFVLQLSLPLHVLDRRNVIRLQQLHKLDDLVLNVALLHPRVEDQGDELLKLHILCRDVPQLGLSSLPPVGSPGSLTPVLVDISPIEDGVSRARQQLALSFDVDGILRRLVVAFVALPFEIGEEGVVRSWLDSGFLHGFDLLERALNTIFQLVLESLDG